MVFTDPPYALMGNSTGVNGITDDKMTAPFFREIFNMCKNFTKPFAHIYVCCDWHSAFAIEAAARFVELPAKNLCVWDKGDGGVGAMYQHCHELIWLFDNTPINKTLGHGKTGVRTVNGVPNIWRFPREGNDRVHGAQKPVGLVETPIKHGCDDEQVVLDLFCGSGTTIVAAQNLNRRCYAMEISEKYAAVILQRFSDAFPDLEITRYPPE